MINSSHKKFILGHKKINIGLIAVVIVSAILNWFLIEFIVLGLSQMDLMATFPFFAAQFRNLKSDTKASETWNVWTEDLLIDKIRPQYDPAVKNSTINIKGAKNEWVAFQVAVRPSGENVSNITPEIQATLKSGNNNIADSNFVFYINDYVNLDNTERCYATEQGNWPDVCVPYRDRWYNEKRDNSERGWGQTLNVNSTQPFLVEIYIPANATPGDYTGTIKFTADGVVSGVKAFSQEIMVNLTVWPFSIPKQWTLTNLWHIEGNYGSLDPAAFGGRDDSKAPEYLYRIAQAASDHGIWPYGGGATSWGGAASRRSDQCYGTTPSFTEPAFTGQWGWKNFLDGTASQDYNPKPYPIPSVFCTRRTDVTSGTWKESTEFLDNWGKWISQNGYDKNTLFVDKFLDEPTVQGMDLSAYAEIHAERHKSYPYPLRPYEYYTAASQPDYPKNTVLWDDEYRHMWCVKSVYNFYRPVNYDNPFGNFADFNQRKSQYGDILWLYHVGITDFRFFSVKDGNVAASMIIDALARQNAFAMLEAWPFKASGIYHWGMNTRWDRTADQVWEENSPFAAHDSGDGMMLYPGRPSGTNNDIGGTHEIPVESFRLKLFRWGNQVYEYCKLLEALGKTSFADTQVARMMNFSTKPPMIGALDNWENAREMMAAEIINSISTGVVGINNNQAMTNSANVTLSLKITDPLGVEEMKISNTKDISSAQAEPYVTSKLWGLAGGDGAKTVYVWTKNSSGSWNSTPYQGTITVDTLAPKITGNTESFVTQTGATISWTTDEQTISQVEYGQTVSYGSQTQKDNAMTLAHAQNLSGLSAGTTYHYRVISVDGAGNISHSQDKTFLTANDSNGNDNSGTSNGNSSSDSEGNSTANSGNGTSGTSAGSSGANTGGNYSSAEQGTSGMKDIIPPSEVIDISVSVITDRSVTLNWTAPGDDNDNGRAKQYEIKYSTSPITKENWDKVTHAIIAEPKKAGNAESFSISNLEPNKNYYFAIKTKDEANNWSEISSLLVAKTSKPENSIGDSNKKVSMVQSDSNNGTGVSCKEGSVKDIFGVSKEIAECVSRAEAQNIYAYNKTVPLDNDGKKFYLEIMQRVKKNLTMERRYSIAEFIHDGTGTTKILGAGERAGVINSYITAFDKPPETENEWQDVVKIANGRWPNGKNDSREKETQEKTFMKIYRRAPNMNNVNDNAAVTIITYGLRPVQRNTGSEKTGIRIFKGVYGHNPATASEWDIVRAIAYSGAKR